MLIIGVAGGAIATLSIHRIEPQLARVEAFGQVFGSTAFQAAQSHQSSEGQVLEPMLSGL